MNRLAVTFFVLSATVLPALAQDHAHDHLAADTKAKPAANMSGDMRQGMMQGGMMQKGMMGMGNMSGMHVIALTVTSLDSKTGLVEGSADGLALKLHFPPASLATIKPGDKLSVHLGFTKP